MCIRVATGRRGVSSLTPHIRSLKLCRDMARGAVQPARDRTPVDQQRCFNREHGEDLLADITRKLEIARATERRPGDKALVSSDQFGECTMGTLFTPTLEERGIALTGDVAVHSL